eukprot:scaffold27078_cov73-Isochrysis_galbana.AAC.1
MAFQSPRQRQACPAARGLPPSRSGDFTPAPSPGRQSRGTDSRTSGSSSCRSGRRPRATARRQAPPPRRSPRHPRSRPPASGCGRRMQSPVRRPARRRRVAPAAALVSDQFQRQPLAF